MVFNAQFPTREKTVQANCHRLVRNLDQELLLLVLSGLSDSPVLLGPPLQNSEQNQGATRALASTGINIPPFSQL